MTAPLLLMFMAASAVPTGDGVPAQHGVTKIATASVTILSAERISDEHMHDEKRDRQVRLRDNRRLVEFF